VKRAFSEASLEAEKAFGNAALYMEKFITGGRHIEFQVLADAFGNAIHLGERECSIQRNHQKLLEESPSPVIDGNVRDSLGRKVSRAVAAAGYVNAGTVEFLRDVDGSLYFMEMNARLQVEHPVTEMVTGVDIVKEQLRIAANCRLSVTQDDIDLDGNAIEVRINAEDPSDGFKPDPGTITAFEAPAGDGVRIDTHIEKGYTIPPFYDSMICKLIGHGPDRKSAIRTVMSALEAFRIEGVSTTIPLHKKILAAAGFQEGTYNTDFITELMTEEGQRHNG